MQEGQHTFRLVFDQVRQIEVAGKEYSVEWIACVANRVCKKKKKWVSWTGDAFCDWHTGQFTIPGQGIIEGSWVDSDLSTWDDYEGEIPELGTGNMKGFLTAVLHSFPKWDDSKEVIDLSNL